MNWLGSNLDETWRANALCAQTGPDDHTWFAGNGIKPTEAQALCAGCVNPAHLRELENHLNLRRAIPRGDAATEHRRSRWRAANARRRGTYRYTEGGE